MVFFNFQPGVFGDVRKGTVAIVVEKLEPADPGFEQVAVAVVVVVRTGYSDRDLERSLLHPLCPQRR